MSTRNLLAMLLYGVGLILGVASLVMAYTGLPESYDTEPVLAFGLLLVTTAGIASIRD